MTELQKLYEAARAGRRFTPPRPQGHHAALREVARKTGIDKDTVDRCLRRARRADAVEAKRAKAAA
jgi:ABC-type nitrate/sulfonate/bicarbonate transport system substrate-binding protein